jgi:hypothetical protein
MRQAHRIISALILGITTLICYMADAHMTDSVSQNLVTFFSIVFGFYLIWVALLYGTSYTKKLYQEIDSQNQRRRKIHTLKRYLLVSGYWCIFSITSIIVYTLFADKNASGVLNFTLCTLVVPFSEIPIYSSQLLNGIIFGISSVNIFFMLLILHTLLDGMIEEAKQ